MIILLVVLASLVLAYVRGGKLGNLGSLNIRWSGLILAGFLLQIVIFSPDWRETAETRPLTQAAYVFSMVLLFVALAVNFKIPGIPLMMVGFLSNFLAILLNGGHMPATASALDMAGWVHLGPGQVFNNSIGAGPDTWVPFLTDIFAIPDPFPFHNVFSIGDALIGLGGFYMVQKIMVQTPTTAPS